MKHRVFGGHPRSAKQMKSGQAAEHLGRAGHLANHGPLKRHRIPALVRWTGSYSMVNISLFGRFVPLQTLVPSDRAQLAKQSSLVNYQPGKAVFSRGELARTQAYLIEGELELQDDHAAVRLRATDPESRYTLAPGQRRSATALCIKACQILFVDRELLDVMLTWSQTGGVEARDVEQVQVANGIPPVDSPDWMTALLQSKAFLRIPPGNIAQIFASMEPINFEAGEIILKQGDPGDYYYVITEGRAQVLLEDPDGRNEEELAQLGVGRGFGEEALVSGEPRNATVRALTRCALMRLSSSAFTRLLKAPLMIEVQLSEAHAQVEFMDVRVPGEFGRGHLPGAINIPLARIRQLVRGLNSSREYWVYCDTGRRSASATFLLNERGFNAKLIKGGVAVTQLVEGS